MSGLLTRDTDFRRFWLGQSVSVAGTEVTAVALPLVATLALHAGAAGVSVVATAAYLPNLALPLWVGHWLEPRRRRRFLIAADVVRALALTAVPIAYLLDALSVPLLVGVALVVGAASVVFDVGRFAYVPSVVASADLPAANRALQGSSTAAQVGGPGLAGLLVQAIGAPLTMTVDAVSYLGSVLGLVGVRRPEPEPDRGGQRPGVFEGVRQLAVNPFLRALTVHAALYNLCWEILTVNLIVYAVHDRDVSAGGYGLALSAGGLGAFAGTMLALRLAHRLGYGHAFIASLAFSTGVPVLLALLPGRGAVLAALLAAISLVAGVGLGSANVLSVTIRQALVPAGSLARSVGAYRLVIFGVLPIGGALGGVIGVAAGSRTAVLVATIGLTLSAVPMVQRRVRTLADPTARETSSEARPAETVRNSQA